MANLITPIPPLLSYGLDLMTSEPMVCFLGVFTWNDPRRISVARTSRNFWLQYRRRPLLELGFGNGRHRGLFISSSVRGASLRLSTPNSTTIAATAKISSCSGAGGRCLNPHTTAGR